MREKILFELCAETILACLAARDGGANRIELCSALGEDGLTPSHGFTRAAIEQSELPVHVLVRPRGGDFVYGDDEFALLRDDVVHAREQGASGVVMGVLKADRTVDIERTRELVELAGPLEVTFHRAFDLTPSLDAALEDVIATGCRRLLTSGGELDVVAGMAQLARLVKLTAGRIEIAAGGGVRPENAAKVVAATGVRQLHGSLRRKVQSGQEGVLPSAGETHMVDPDEVRAMMKALGQT